QFALDHVGFTSFHSVTVTVVTARSGAFSGPLKTIVPGWPGPTRKSSSSWPATLGRSKLSSIFSRLLPAVGSLANAKADLPPETNTAITASFGSAEDA